MNAPRLATWLLQRWGSGPMHESLAGDLVEQYQQGRSAAWYWRQVLRAISAGIVHEMGAHKVLAVRALVVGWIAIDLTGRARWDIVYVALRVPIGTPVNIPVSSWFLVYLYLTLGVMAGLSGWVVARLHRPYAMPMVTIFATSFALYLLIDLIARVTQAVGSPHWTMSYIASEATELFVRVCVIPMLMILGGLLGAGTIQSPRRPQSQWRASSGPSRCSGSPARQAGSTATRYAGPRASSSERRIPQPGAGICEDTMTNTIGDLLGVPLFAPAVLRPHVGPATVDGK